MQQCISVEVLGRQHSAIFDQSLDDLSTSGPRGSRQTELAIWVLRPEVVTIGQRVDQGYAILAIVTRPNTKFQIRCDADTSYSSY